MEQKRMFDNLKALNKLLIEERVAITALDMNRLQSIQRKKTALLCLLHENKCKLDEKCLKLADQVKKNNKRNSWILRYGLKMVSRLRRKNLVKQTLTYNPGGSSLTIDQRPRVVSSRS